MLKFVICGIFLLYLVQCNFGSEVEDIDNKTIKMPEKKWADYKVEHDKQYEAEEDAKRFEIFKAALKMIEEHNAKFAKGETTYTMGLNHMTDWTPEEKNQMLGVRQPPPSAS